MPFRYKKRRSKPCSGMVPLTELDYIMVSASSSRRRGTVHRTVLFNGFESFAKQKNEAFLQEYLKKTGAANRTRTGTELPQADFKSAMSTYSIIAAKGFLPQYPLRNGLEGEIKLSYSSTVSRERQVL